MKLSVVIPAYNEEANIEDVVKSVKTVLPDAEIIVVNDGSTDKTGEIALKAGALVIDHPYNIGNGAAVKSGIRLATGDKIVLMDGDGQHDPSDIQKLLDASDMYDMVVGCRDPHTHASFFRRYANFFYNMLATFIAKFKVEDLTSGFRIVKKDIILRYLYLMPNSFSYPTTVTLAYLRSGRSIGYIPVKAKERKGSSKIRVLHDGFRFLLIIIKITTLFSPLIVFLPFSLLFFFMGLINYAYTFITAHEFTNMSALFFSTSVILFMMGLISEQITQTRYDKIDNGG